MIKIPRYLYRLLLPSFLIFVWISACGQNQGASSSGQNGDIPVKVSAEDSSITSEPLKVSILGDSYSTFEGYIPEGYIAWYKPVPKEGRPTDVTRPEQTWWSIFIEQNGFELERNNSYSGATICNTGYDGNDYSDRSFVNRTDSLGNPDLILIYGATNDSWADSPLGEYRYEDFNNESLYQFRPAMSYMLSRLQSRYPKARLLVMVNGPDILKPDIIESIETVCRHYEVDYLMLSEFDKMSGHPDQNGMKSIAAQLNEYIKGHKINR